MSVNFADLSTEVRLAALELKPCKPLLSAQGAIDLAIARFHESWHAYRTITPTLYLIGPQQPGHYLTLGRLRRRYTLDAATFAAILATLRQHRAVEGYLLAGEAVGGVPLRALFGLKGHDGHNPLFGALDLAFLSPFEGDFRLETDLSSESWAQHKQEAWTNSAFPLR